MKSPKKSYLESYESSPAEKSQICPKCDGELELTRTVRRAEWSGGAEKVRFFDILTCPACGYFEEREKA